MQHGLTLSFAAFQIARFAVLPDRGHVARDRAPSPDLPTIVGGPAAHVIPTVPLEPPARILRANPPAEPPGRQRLGRVHAKVIESCLAAACGQPRASEPGSWKFRATVGQVFPAEHPEPEHLPWRELRREFRREVPAGRLGQVIHVTVLHAVVDDHFLSRAPHVEKAILLRTIAAHERGHGCDELAGIDRLGEVHFEPALQCPGAIL